MIDYAECGREGKNIKFGAHLGQSGHTVSDFKRLSLILV